jgi:hypothetical protein
LEDNGEINYQPVGLNKKNLMIAFTQKDKNDCNKMTFLWLDINRNDAYIHTKIICFLMVVWNSMLLKIIIILLGVEKQHVRFIQPSGLESECISESPPIPLEVMHI